MNFYVKFLSEKTLITILKVIPLYEIWKILSLKKLSMIWLKQNFLFMIMKKCMNCMTIVYITKTDYMCSIDPPWSHRESQGWSYGSSSKSQGSLYGSSSNSPVIQGGKSLINSKVSTRRIFVISFDSSGRYSKRQSIIWTFAGLFSRPKAKWYICFSHQRGPRWYHVLWRSNKQRNDISCRKFWDSEKKWSMEDIPKIFDQWIILSGWVIQNPFLLWNYSHFHR